MLNALIICINENEVLLQNHQNPHGYGTKVEAHLVIYATCHPLFKISTTLTNRRAESAFTQAYGRFGALLFIRLGQSDMYLRSMLWILHVFYAILNKNYAN